MPLAFIERPEVDDNWDWFINLSGGISICCCFFFMWMVLLSDQVQRDPFVLSGIDSIPQPSNGVTQETKESIKALRAMLYNLNEFAGDSRNVIFNKILSGVNLPCLESDLGQLRVTFNEDGGRELFKRGSSKVVDGFKKQLLGFVKHLMIPDPARTKQTQEQFRIKQVERIKRIEIQVHSASDSGSDSTGSYASKWELDIARANDVKHVMEAWGIPPELRGKTIVSGYGDQYPFVDENIRYIFDFDRAILEAIYDIEYDSALQSEGSRKNIDQKKLETVKKIEGAFRRKGKRLDKVSKLMAIRPGKLWILIDRGPVGRSEEVTYLLKAENAQLNVYQKRRDLERQDMQGKNRRVVILVSIDVNNKF